MTIYFYAQTDEYSEFSNFAPLGVEMDDVWWRAVEHYFQAQKFLNPAFADVPNLKTLRRWAGLVMYRFGRTGKRLKMRSCIEQFERNSKPIGSKAIAIGDRRSRHC